MHALPVWCTMVVRKYQDMCVAGGWVERSEAALIRPLGYPIDEVRELRFTSNIWILPTPKSEIPGLSSGKALPEAGAVVLCIMDTSRNH